MIKKTFKRDIPLEELYQALGASFLCAASTSARGYGRARWPTTTVAALRIDFCSFICVNKCSRTTQINKFPECPEHRKLLWQPQLWDTNKTFQIYTIAKFSPSAAQPHNAPSMDQMLRRMPVRRTRCVCVCRYVHVVWFLVDKWWDVGKSAFFGLFVFGALFSDFRPANICISIIYL